MALHYIPTYDGQAIFGVAYTVAVVGYPHEIDWRAFPGVHGRFGVRMGSRGFFAIAEFTQTAADEDYLAAFESIWNTYRNTATAAVLFDTLGQYWANAVVVEFEPQDRVLPGRAGGVVRSYRARFEICR